MLLPLVTIYLAILYAYMFRIIIRASWPVGWVSYLVIDFSTAGILSLLLIYPVRNDTRNKWILVFSRFFYIALFPLIVLLFFAVKKRISDYGITEDRYFILTLAVWLLFIATYFLFPRSKNIKIIPISLSLLALIAAFGPWSAFSVSRRSQDSRLANLLNKNNLLKNGKIVPQKDSVSYSDNEQIQSIVAYMTSVHGYNSLQHFFATNLDSVFPRARYDNANEDFDNDYTESQKIETLMNIRLIKINPIESSNRGGSYISVTQENQNNVVDIHGYDYSISYCMYSSSLQDSICKTFNATNDSFSGCYNVRKKEFAFRNGNKTDSSLNCSLSSMFNNFETGYGARSLPPQEMTYNNSNDKWKVMIVFDNVTFYNAVSDTTINFTATIYVKNLTLSP